MPAPCTCQVIHELGMHCVSHGVYAGYFLKGLRVKLELEHAVWSAAVACASAWSCSDRTRACKAVTWALPASMTACLLSWLPIYTPTTKVLFTNGLVTQLSEEYGNKKRKKLTTTKIKVRERTTKWPDSQLPVPLFGRALAARIVWPKLGR